MARNSVVLIRQLLGNRNHPCAAGFLHHLHDKRIQNLTSVPNTASSSTPMVAQTYSSLRASASITMHLIKLKNGPGPTVDVFGVHRNMNTGSTLDKLGIHETPTFHCYLKGERVHEVAGISARHLKKRLENVYNPSGIKKKRRQGKEDDKDGGIVEVLPCRLPETSIQKVILELEQLVFDEDHLKVDLNDLDDLELDQKRHDQDKMWWFAKGLVSCEKKMKIFCKLKDPKAKLKWIKREMAKE